MNKPKDTSGEREKMEYVPATTDTSPTPKLIKYRLTLGFFIRSVALLYFISFSHLTVQVIPLIGAKGISPVALFLKRTESLLGHSGYAKFFYFPTIFWVSADDTSIMGSCVVGSLLSLMLFFGIYGKHTTKLNLLLCYVIKLSLCVTGGDLFAFPWDYLLMETTILCIFLPPLKPLLTLRSQDSHKLKYKHNPSSICNSVKIDYGLESEPSSINHRLVHFSLTFLCVRFMLAMGLEKVPFINDCEEWWNLTYLKNFYEREQPMPTALAWNAYHFPMAFHKFSAWSTWVVELLVPFMCFMSNIYWKRAGSILLMLFQVPIMITGNYSILNWLTVILCIPSLDDGLMPKTMAMDQKKEEREKVTLTVNDATAEASSGNRKKARRRQTKDCGITTLQKKTFGPILKIALIFHFLIGMMYTIRIIEPAGVSYLANPNWIFDRRYDHSIANQLQIMPKQLLLWLQRYHIIQQYGGVFHSTFGHDGKMVNIIEGSHDGKHWFEYKYKYHVQDIDEPPQFFAPLFPRLDHFIFYETNQIGFNRINPMSPLFAQNPSGSTFLQLIQRLLENEPSVLQLFRANDNLKKKPLYIRVNVYNYRFTPLSHNAASNSGSQYWTRRRVIEMLPPVSLHFQPEEGGINSNSKYRYDKFYNMKAKDNFYAICYYILLNNGVQLDEILKNCNDLIDDDANGNYDAVNYVYNFEEPSAIYKHSKPLYFLASIMGMQSSYIESTREMLKWNSDENKTIDFNIFSRIVNLRDGCEEYIIENVKKLRGGGKLARKLLKAGITLLDMQRMFYYSNVESAKDTAQFFFDNGDAAPTSDNKLTLEEIMTCTECYYLLCRDYYTTHLFA